MEFGRDTKWSGMLFLQSLEKEEDSLLDVLNTSRNLVLRSSIETFKSVQENKFRVQNH